MITRKQLKNKIILQEFRIKELEEKLCPCEQHDWLKIGYNPCNNFYTYKCKRCCKMVTTWRIY